LGIRVQGLGLGVQILEFGATAVTCCPAKEERVRVNTRRPCARGKSRRRPAATARVASSEYVFISAAVEAPAK